MTVLRKYNSETSQWDIVFTGSVGPTGPTGPTGSSAVISNEQTSSYTLVLSDYGKMIEMNVSSANTLTVPADSSVNFDIGTQIMILQTGTGQTTITPDSGVTIYSKNSEYKLDAQWSSAVIIKRAADTWVALGDLVT